jgi:cell division septation protein DedD
VLVTPTVVDPLTETEEPTEPGLPIPTLDKGSFDKSLGKDGNPTPVVPPVNPAQPASSNQAPAAPGTSSPTQSVADASKDVVPAALAPQGAQIIVAPSRTVAASAQATLSAAIPTPASAAAMRALPAPALVSAANPVSLASPTSLIAPQGPADYKLQGPTVVSMAGAQMAKTSMPSMVQVMTLSNKQDADAMVASLRRHGYNVAVNHDSTDKLLHLEVGPFPNQTDAEAMRQRLVVDGYNATIK